MTLKVIPILFVGLAILAVAAAGDHSLRKRGLTILLKVLTDGCKGGACRNADLIYKGKAFRPTSCLDYLRRGTSKSGIFKLYDHGGNSYSAYCDLKSEPGTAWTLVMSWSTLYRTVPAFFNIPFKFNAPVNENAQNWNAYRLSLARMKFLQSHSTHWRSTCSFPTNGVDFKDYMRGTFRNFNVVDFIGVNQCKKVEYINIREHVGVNLTVRFWQGRSWFLHTDSSPTYNSCQFDAKKGSAHEEDNFGHYNHINPKFRCTAGTQSTTQWWFGARL